MTVKELRQFLRKIPSDYTIVDADILTEIIEQELHISDKHKMVIYKATGGKDDTDEKIVDEIKKLFEEMMYPEDRNDCVYGILKKYGKID